MKNFIPMLEKTSLFEHISTSNIEFMLNCLSSKVVHYKKDEFILYSGDNIDSLGMVIKGNVLILKEDFWGNRSIISEVSEGFPFAETYAFISTIPLEVSVVASTDCTVLFLNIKKILNTCSASCTFHNKLIENLLTDVAKKNMILTRKIEHMSKKTIREKILSYLSSESQKNNSASFKIPFDRQELADYLSVDRSALSNELSKLMKENIIIFKKNAFTLIDKSSFNTLLS
ncbi:MAG: Crp/Fnr family transcriptional regulator [Proteocatella sp.]